MKLRCYCCGERIGNAFVLVSHGNSVDRVFVMKPEHADKAEDTHQQWVERKPPAR